VEVLWWWAACGSRECHRRAECVGADDPDGTGRAKVRTPVERASTDLLVRDHREPAFDLIQPRALGRREKHVEAQSLGQ